MENKINPLDQVKKSLTTLFIRSAVFNAQGALYEALSEAGRFLEADRMSILRLVASSHKLVSLAQWFRNTEYYTLTGIDGYYIDLKSFPVWNRLVNSPRPFILNNFNELEEKANNEKNLLQQEGIQSMVSMPVLRDSRVIGCINVVSAEKERIWSQDQIDFLEWLSGLVSSFLERVEQEAHNELTHSYEDAEDDGPYSTQQQYLNQSRIISQAGLDLMQLQGKDHILAYIAEALKYLFPRSIISVSEYDENRKLITTRHLRGINSRIRKILDLLKIEPEGQSYPLSDDDKAFRIMLGSVFHKIEGGLHEATMGSIGAAKCNMLEKLNRIKAVYGAGLQANGKLYGTIIIAFCGKTPVLGSLMESFIRMASLAIYRVETQKELVLSRNYLQNILSAMTEGVLEIDLKGNITFLNPAVLNFIGYEKNELLGKNVSAFLSEEQDLQTLAAHTIGTIPDTRQSFELNVKAKDGKNLEIRANTIVLKDNKGKPRGFLGVLTDQSKIRERERTLGEIKLSQELLGFKQQFLSNMSHEMLTPINGIVGVAQLLTSSITEASDRELLCIINESSEQLLRVVKSIWEANSLKEGTLGVSEKEFSLCNLLCQNSSLFAASAKEKNIKINIYCDHNKDVTLLADELRINQVLTNLIGNAIKFNHNNGVVHISSKTSFNGDHNGNIRFEVKDNGPGIPAGKQPGLFEIFEQVDNSNTRKHDGLGLGLHLCRQLVELMNGEMGFESTEGEGSTFWFEVPVKRALSEAKECSNKCRLS